MIAIATLTALAILAIICVWRWSAAAAVALAVVSAAWLPLSNGRLEGAVLVTFDAGHGLTASDLLSYLGLLIVIWSTARARRARPGSSPLPWLAAPALLACG